MIRIAHIRDKYLGVSFIYFLLKGFEQSENYLFCREVDENDVAKYPYEKIVKTSSVFLLSWFWAKFTQIKFGRRMPNDWIAYLWKIKKRKIDLIHAHMGRQGVYALPLAKKLNKPLVTTFYGADMSKDINDRYWYNKYQRLFSESYGVIVEGEHMKRMMVKLGCQEEKVFVSKIGIPVNDIKFTERNTSDKSVLKILMAATFTHKKGFFDAIEVFNLMKKRQRNFHVTIVGDGFLKSEIESKVSNYQLQNEITFVGRKTLPEIYELSKEFHVFFHPSKYGPTGDSEGGAPTIILEMQALGLPVVSTTHADIPNIIPKSNHFLLTAEGDIEALYQRVIYFQKNDIPILQITQQGRHFVETHHSNQVCGKKLEAFYIEVIHKYNK